MSKNAIVIYHSPCHDGFGAAWAARFVLKHQLKSGALDSLEFWPASHGSDPPDVTDKDVYMVDFAYKPEVLREIARQAHSLVVLDHHKSAQEDLKDFKHPNTSIHFDMLRSGTGLAWDYFWSYAGQLPPSPAQNRPWLVNYIEDRDLWNHKLPNTNEVNAFLFSLPYDFETWDRVSTMPLAEAVSSGQWVLEYKERQMERVVGTDLKNVCRRRVKGYTVPIINTTVMQSEIGNKLAQDEPFSVMYLITKENQVLVSFRSTDEGVDVSQVAKSFGGGGHRNAAGCRWDFETLMGILKDD